MCSWSGSSCFVILDNVVREGTEISVNTMDLYAHLYTNHSLHGQCPLYVDPFSVDRVYVTERVPVPSSNHVAEIVGKLGCKIKALQAITNTYIKTPVRGKDPVFIVAGRKQAVEIAKQEILAAADHFTIIRAKTNGISGTNQRPPKLPGHVTRWVSVPYHLVGLVVGTKGATIKWIQQNTGTYIVTPHRDKYPVFEVTGLPENIVQVRERIKMYLTMRTGYKVDVYLVNNFNCIGRDVYRHLPRDGSDNLLDKMPNREQAIGVRLPTQGYFSLSSTNYSLSSAAHGSGSAAHACPTDSSSSVDQHKNEHICIVCEETEVSTVHLPCGHCLFCMDCAMLICQLVRPECPACHTPATQAIQISA